MEKITYYYDEEAEVIGKFVNCDTLSEKFGKAKVLKDKKEKILEDSFEKNRVKND